MSWLDILNELGSEGWRLIESETLDTAMPGGTRYGWADYAIPIRMHHFMREVSS